MNENTNVLVYGVCTERKNLIAESFDWKKILSNFMQLTKNEFNLNYSPRCCERG